MDPKTLDAISSFLVVYMDLDTLYVFLALNRHNRGRAPFYITQWVYSRMVDFVPAEVSKELSSVMISDIRGCVQFLYETDGLFPHHIRMIQSYIHEMTIYPRARKLYDILESYAHHRGGTLRASAKETCMSIKRSGCLTAYRDLDHCRWTKDLRMRLDDETVSQMTSDLAVSQILSLMVSNPNQTLLQIMSRPISPLKILYDLFFSRLCGWWEEDVFYDPSIMSLIEEMRNDREGCLNGAEYLLRCCAQTGVIDDLKEEIINVNIRSYKERLNRRRGGHRVNGNSMYT